MLSMVMRAEVVRRDAVPEEWAVEAIDDDGGIEMAVFSGPEAEVRALEYAAWKYDPRPGDLASRALPGRST